jgi:hypothetical protein
MEGTAGTTATMHAPSMTASAPDPSLMEASPLDVASNISSSSAVNTASSASFGVHTAQLATFGMAAPLMATSSLPLSLEHKPVQTIVSGPASTSSMLMQQLFTKKSKKV